MKSVTTTVRGIPDLMCASLVSVNREGYQSTVVRPRPTTGVFGRYETNEWRAHEQETYKSRVLGKSYDNQITLNAPGYFYGICDHQRQCPLHWPLFHPPRLIEAPTIKLTNVGVSALAGDADT